MLTLLARCVLWLGMMMSVVFASVPPAPIDIGVIYNSTGVQSSLDIPSLQGARLAVKQINQAGGVLGRPLRLLVKDGASKATQVGSVAQALASQANINVLMGLSDDNLLKAAMPPVKAASKLFLSSGATGAYLAKEYPNSLFLTSFSDQDQGRAAANFAWQQGKRKAFIIGDRSMAFARTAAAAFIKQFRQLGGQVIGRLSVNSQTIWPQRLLAYRDKLKTADVIYLSVGPSLVLPGINSLRAAHVSQSIIGPDSFSLAAMTSPVNATVLKDVYYTTHAYFGVDASARASAFADAYQQHHDKAPTAFSALGYDTVYLIAHAITNAGDVSAVAIRRGLQSMHRYVGATGDLRFAPGSNQATNAVYVVTVDQGKIKLANQQPLQ